MRQVTENCWEQNKDVHKLFINFEAEYDAIEKENME
jgi:hypothetical protein